MARIRKRAGMGKICIVSDLMKVQQEEDKKLREEVKALRLSEEYSLECLGAR